MSLAAQVSHETVRQNDIDRLRSKPWHFVLLGLLLLIVQVLLALNGC